MNLGGGEYQYDYSIYNNGSVNAGAAIQLFDIYFDPTLYTDVSYVSPVSGWTEQVFPAGGDLPADFDVSAQAGNNGIQVGSTVSGFEVDFDYLGQGQPGSQPFQISDPNSFALLQSGNTICTATLANFQGGTASSPVGLPAGGCPVGSVGITTGGQGLQDYYSFLWAGGAFNVTAFINNGTNASFSYGVVSGSGGCSSLGSATLNSGDNFTGIVGNNAALAAGEYCIGIDAVSLDPQFTLTFNTPVEGIIPAAPEPSTFALFFVGTGMLIVVLRRRRAAGKV
jgi:hypothetical protein